MPSKAALEQRIEALELKFDALDCYTRQIAEHFRLTLKGLKLLNNKVECLDSMCEQRTKNGGI